MIIGIDEVGRGCWAGPLVAAAVRLKQPVSGLADSKKLTAKKRQQLHEALHMSGADIGVGWVTAQEVDQVGLTAAVGMAMRRALNEIAVQDDRIIIDGNYNYLPDIAQTETQVGADGTVDAVSAASIIAKVARDAYMHTLDETLPGYGFARHVGYGTAIHRQALRNYGVTAEHRKSYKPVAAALVHFKG